MSRKHNTLRKSSLLVGVVLFAVSVASPSFAKEPYYFVDDNSNTQALYTNASCNGVESSCVGFGDYCGTRFYSSSYSLEQARELWKYKGYINIRQNSGNYEVVCALKK
jgi:hypothetical protein